MINNILNILIKRNFIIFIFFIVFSANFYGFSLNELTAKLDVDKANRLFKKGNYEDAISLYERALSKVTNSPQIYYNMATAMTSIGETDTAIRLFEMAKNNFNDKTSKYIKNAAHYNLGIAKIENEDYEGAINELIESLVNNPKDENAKRALEYAKKKLEEQKNNSGSQNSPQNKQNEPDDNENSGNSENNNMDNNSNDNDSNYNNEEKSDIDRLLESLRQFRKDKDNEEQYYGGGRIDKDW